MRLASATTDFGDYYLLGEANPQLLQRYRNLDLTYLPAASAFALQYISGLGMLGDEGGEGVGFDRVRVTADV